MTKTKKPLTEKRKPGRPKTGGLYTMQEHIFLDEGTAAKLAQLAKEAGLTKSAYIRQLIQAQ